MASDLAPTSSTGALKLYLVSVDFEFYVAAKSEREAESVARDNMDEALRDEFPWPMVSEVTDAKEIGRDHTGDIPYGDPKDNPQDLTCAQILDYTAPGKLDYKGPVHWCEECYEEEVQFDWREERQLCAGCKARVKENA